MKSVPSEICYHVNGFVDFVHRNEKVCKGSIIIISLVAAVALGVLLLSCFGGSAIKPLSFISVKIVSGCLAGVSIMASGLLFFGLFKKNETDQEEIVGQELYFVAGCDPEDSFSDLGSVISEICKILEEDEEELEVRDQKDNINLS